MKIANENGLEIEDIIDFPKEKEKELLKKFWIGPSYLKYIFGNYAKGNVKTCLRKLEKQGFHIEIHTSRGISSSNAMVSFANRFLTRIQLFGLGLSRYKVFFHRSDEKKVDDIIKRGAYLYFDDKPSVIDRLVSAGAKVICVSGNHNKMIEEGKQIRIIDTFDEKILEEKICQLVGRDNYKCIVRENLSKAFFNRVIWLSNVAELKFTITVLHKENMVTSADTGIIYAPNHMKTLDPIIINSIIHKNIHWVALKRFFEGKDSIFNNNKNFFLCKITEYFFKKLELFPIERVSDNPKANNYNTMKDMCVFLRNRYRIGIFAEGTTRKNAGCDFGNFSDAFIQIARKTKSCIQPITIYWKNSNEVVVSFSPVMSVNADSEKDAFDSFMKTQSIALEECKNHYRNVK